MRETSEGSSMEGKVTIALVTLLAVLLITGSGCPQPTDTTIQTVAQSIIAYPPPPITVSYDFDDSGNWVEH